MKLYSISGVLSISQFEVQIPMPGVCQCSMAMPNRNRSTTLTFTLWHILFLISKHALLH